MTVGLGSEDWKGGRGETSGHDGLPAILHRGRVAHHGHIGLLLGSCLGDWDTDDTALTLSQVLVTMCKGARVSILARAIIEVLASGSFEVLVSALRSAAIIVVLLIAISSLHVSTSAAALVRASASAATLVVTGLLVAAAAGVLMSTASSALLMETLVVLLHNGCFCVSIGWDWIRDLSQLVLSVGKETRHTLRARPQLHEVTAELSLELLGVELGPGSHRSMIASTILITAVSTSVVVVLLSTIGTTGIGTRATESVLLRATDCLELTGHLRLI